MLKKRILSLITLVLTLALALLTGCGGTIPESNKQPSVTSTTQTAYPLTFKDDSGTSVTLASQPKRIVCLVPSATETLFALGVGEKVVAVTKWDNYQKEQVIAKKVATIKDSDRLRVWTEVSETLYTPGEGTFLDELVTKAGGLNIARDVKGWGMYNSEQVITKNPQVIFETYGYYQKDAVANILARKGWQNVDAVKNKRVLELDNDLITRTGPRIVDGLEAIAKALYPDLFK